MSRIALGLKRGRKPKKVVQMPPPPIEDDSKPPRALHFGYRADMLPRSAGLCRWWQSQGWNGQFDLITWEEKKKREEAALSLQIPVYDYDEMCWD
jgi:hypothetical protein